MEKRAITPRGTAVCYAVEVYRDKEGKKQAYVYVIRQGDDICDEIRRDLKRISMTIYKTKREASDAAKSINEWAEVLAKMKKQDFEKENES